ncbi:unnamed protein product [Ascophyllum nodosum]
MRSTLCMLLIAVSALFGDAFVLAPANAAGSMASSLREDSFVSSILSAKLAIAQGGGRVYVSRSRPSRGDLRMGKVSKFGIFSPAVVAAKIALGEGRLNKIRGKVIALHSQVITEYCRWVGAPSKVRGLLIRKAKRNGDDLGFLW